MRDAASPAGARTSSNCPDLPVKRDTLRPRDSAPPLALSARMAAGNKAAPSDAATTQLPDPARAGDAAKEICMKLLPSSQMPVGGKPNSDVSLGRIARGAKGHETGAP